MQSSHDFRKLPDGRWQRRQIGTKRWETLTVVERPPTKRNRRPETPTNEWRWA